MDQFTILSLAFDAVAHRLDAVAAFARGWMPALPMVFSFALAASARRTLSRPARAR
jgi:hypothetical protein